MPSLKELVPGQVIEVPGFVYMYTWSPMKFFTTDEVSTDASRVNICPHTLTFTVPADFHPTKAELHSIDKAITVAADAYHSTLRELTERRTALLQLTFEPDGEVVDAAPAGTSPLAEASTDDGCEDEGCPHYGTAHDHPEADDCPF